MADRPLRQLGAWSPETLEGPQRGRVDAGQEEQDPQLTAAHPDRGTRLSLIADRDFR
jgi:hypothetical protein